MEKKPGEKEGTRPVPQSGSPGNNTRFILEDTPAVIIVRAEEVLLVVLVLIIWLAAIALFFNRWGKIRMLEPYQPKFQQQHRSSCPLGDAAITPQQRMSFSKYATSGCDNMYTQPLLSPFRRPRQNSVFVDGSLMTRPPRRVRSAIDIQQMLSETTVESFRRFSSLLPIGNERRDRLSRPRESIIRQCPSKHYLRRPSCVMDRPRVEKHHFLSFDQPVAERRLSFAVERSHKRTPFINIEHNYVQPVVKLEPSDDLSSVHVQQSVEAEQTGSNPSCLDEDEHIRLSVLETCKVSDV